MATALSIPQALEAVTPPWLTAALRRGGPLEHAAVTGVQSTVLGEGHSLFGMLARLSLTYDVREPHAPASLVLKLPLADRPNREVGLRRGAYSREVRFYQEIGARPGIDLPQVYYAVRDEAGERCSRSHRRRSDRSASGSSSHGVCAGPGQRPTV